MLERTIIHLNIADFAVAVERLCDSRLRGRPVIIAAADSQRARVYDMSEEAYRDGVRKGMPLHRLRTFCRRAMVLPPHADRYQRAIQALGRMVLPYTPLVEIADGNGHLFLDVTGTHRLFGPGPDIAWRLGKTARKELGLDPIWTVAPNKLVAKVASRLVKPVGEYIVGAGEEAAFLAHRPLTLLPGIGPVELQWFTDLNISRIGEVARLSTAQLAVFLGKRARHLHKLANGIDSSPVVPAAARPPAIRLVHTLAEDTTRKNVIEKVLYQLVEQVGATLRHKGLAARRLTVTLIYADGVRLHRQGVRRQATANNTDLFALAQTALYRAWQRRVCLRTIQLLCDRLTPPPPQLELFPAMRRTLEKKNSISTALDIIRCRHGQGTITKGRLLAA
jgi:DNA polymerase-4